MNVRPIGTNPAPRLPCTQHPHWSAGHISEGNASWELPRPALTPQGPSTERHLRAKSNKIWDHFAKCKVGWDTGLIPGSREKGTEKARPVWAHGVQTCRCFRVDFQGMTEREGILRFGEGEGWGLWLFFGKKRERKDREARSGDLSSAHRDAWDFPQGSLLPPQKRRLLLSWAAGTLFF